MTSEIFPSDLDTTSIGLTVSQHVNFETKMSMIDEMLTYVNEDGIIQTYFDPSRPRIGTFQKQHASEMFLISSQILLSA